MTDRSDETQVRPKQPILPPPPPSQESAATPATANQAPSAEQPGLAQRLQTRFGQAVQDFRANRDGAADASVAGATAAGPEAAPRVSSVRRRRNARRARLRLTRIDPWSVMKTAFLLSIAFGVVTVVSVLVVWSVLGATGLWDSINATISNVLGSNSQFDVTQYVGTSRVIGFTLLVSVIDVILLTAIATLGAFIYNMAAALLGGIEVTLAEES